MNTPIKNKIQKANDYVNVIDNLEYLYPEVWLERTTLLLHGDRKIDKTPAALLMAAGAAKTGREVLYVDVEHHINKDYIRLAGDNFMVYSPDYESMDDERDFAQLVFESIEETVRTTEIRIFVIDSVTRIASLSMGRNASPAFIMKRLAILQRRFKISILAVADDTTLGALRSIIAHCYADIKIDIDKPIVKEMIDISGNGSDEELLKEIDEKLGGDAIDRYSYGGRLTPIYKEIPRDANP